jgi:hypothetical protein
LQKDAGREREESEEKEGNYYFSSLRAALRMGRAEGPMPLEWSKLFGALGKADHLRRGRQRELWRNRPRPPSQTEHLLDLLDRTECSGK